MHCSCIGSILERGLGLRNNAGVINMHQHEYALSWFLWPKRNVMWKRKFPKLLELRFSVSVRSPVCNYCGTPV